ncbi:MAG TPA: V-type ATPase subunit, partial [Candidatus Fermentibacter sp.]|nr:V-type ATPase subunit [Candidatus Fermentibacter sp.]
LAAAALEGTLPDLVSETGNLERLGPLVREAVSSRSFLELERESDRILMDMLDAGSFELFGPAPLAAFLLKREMEISHLRILLSAKSAGIDRARLQRRLPRG